MSVFWAPGSVVLTVSMFMLQVCLQIQLCRRFGSASGDAGLPQQATVTVPTVADMAERNDKNNNCITETTHVILKETGWIHGHKHDDDPVANI